MTEPRTPQSIDLLIVDDDDEYRSTVVRRLGRRGYRIQEASNGEAALEAVQRREFDVALLDMVMPGMSGVDLTEKLKAIQADCEVVLLTGQGTVETAVRSMKLGAFDYLMKPCPLADLEVVIERAVARRQLTKENVQLKQVLSRVQSAPDMLGNSAPMREVYHLIERAGPTEKAILIQGESGTGKELVARALHRHSLRADRPLVVINCAALAETLLESELFGHEKGSFTGAIASKPGLFEMADGGTLFIDEIGEMPGSLQPKLLRVLEDGSMRRIGSVKERRVDVRIVAATNRDMAAEVKAGRFREDLYYRINVMSLQLPPLRERNGDVALLVRKFLGSEWLIEPEALAAIERYTWPGNIRQLINAIDRAKILADGRTVHLKDLPREVVLGPQPAAPSATAASGSASDPSDASLASIERAHVVEILRRERGNKARAARALGVNRRSLYRLLERYGLSADGSEAPVTDRAS
ncbi:MAG: sigma-54 dependent transcriptional regulator [Planctomycetia bacterium]|nr:sigma-54 dependent transcriptional regulator [Planctomycetia bacterium]